MKTALVFGAGGFIGTHIVKQLKKENFWVRGVDLKCNEFCESEADEFIIADLTCSKVVSKVMFAPNQKELKDDFAFDEVIQLAADMGGMGYLATGQNDANIMYNSGMINFNVAHYASMFGVKKLFYSSSACIFPEKIQQDTNITALKESFAWEGKPESEYGVEKLFSEGLYDAFRRNFGLNVRISRFHNVFGEYTLYDGIRAKAPAALCRKVAMAKDGDFVEVWGDGLATRSFLYIDECVEGVRKLMNSDYSLPINIGSDELISVNNLAKLIIEISGKKLIIKNIEGVQGVRGRNSDNTLIQEVLGWQPTQPLRQGIEKLYFWVEQQVQKTK